MKYIIILSLIFLISCTQNIKKKYFNSFLYEPCMIVNSEQDNTIEGNYLTVSKIKNNDTSVIINLPENFYINESNYKNWILGWGTDKPYYNIGVENIRQIVGIDKKNNIIYLGNLLRGEGFPDLNQRIVFWNKNPSGFVNNLKSPIINTKIWHTFSGQSISFGSVKFDSLLNKWIMFVNEVDTNKIQIYAAISDNLIHWKPVNNGNPILKSSDFENCIWAGKDKTGTICQTPFISDMIHYKNKWYLFLYGYSSDGKRYIGVAISEKTSLGPYNIHKNPILSPGNKGTWNDKGCFYAKIKKYKDGFIMFYDGQNKKGYENVGMAVSNDLLLWKNNINNPVINQHSGWRSLEYSSEPNYIEIHHDSIFLLIGGTKKFKSGLWSHYVTKQMYRKKSGNVNDAQLGIYVSTDGGNSFVANKNNPVFTNNYSNPFENDHMGGNFVFIKTDSADFIIYQAKSSYAGLKYNILLREKYKK